MITNIYTYPELKRQESDKGRFYLDSKNHPVPSVTTVLNKPLIKKTLFKSGAIELVRKKLIESLNRVLILELWFMRL